MNKRTEKTGRWIVIVLMAISVVVIAYGLFNPPINTPLESLLAIIAVIVLFVVLIVFSLWALGKIRL